MSYSRQNSCPKANLSSTFDPGLNSSFTPNPLDCSTPRKPRRDFSYSGYTTLPNESYMDDPRAFSNLAVPNGLLAGGTPQSPQQQCQRTRDTSRRASAPPPRMMRGYEDFNATQYSDIYPTPSPTTPFTAPYQQQRARPARPASFQSQSTFGPRFTPTTPTANAASMRQMQSGTPTGRPGRGAGRPSGQRPNLPGIWEDMDDAQRVYMQRQQALERQRYPEQASYIRKKQTVESNEADAVMQKMRLKTLYRNTNKLNRSPTDEEMFGSAFDHTNMYSANHFPGVYQSSARMNDTSFVQPPGNNSACAGGCAEGNSPEDAEFVAYATNLVMPMLVRRRHMRAAIDEAVRWTSDELDCRGRKQQEKALKQLEVNQHEEVRNIYNDLMNRRKLAVAPQASHVFIDDPEQTSTSSLRGPTTDQLTAEEKAFAGDFTLLVIDTINDFAARDAEMSEDIADNNPDADCQQEMTEEFVAQWTNFEAAQCSTSCGAVDEPDALALETGSAMMEVLARQYKMREEFEKTMAEECTGCKIALVEHFHRGCLQELNTVQVDITNDLWSALDEARKALEARASSSGGTCPSDCGSGADNNARYGTIFRAFLAIYRKSQGEIKALLGMHCDQRREHPSENLAMLFSNEWEELRANINEELHEVSDSLKFAGNESMTCQERNLKSRHDAEINAVMEKYQQQIELHPCKTNQLQEALNDELDAIARNHSDQWEQLIMSKLERKLEAIEKIYPKDSKSMCVQTCEVRRRLDRAKEGSDEDKVEEDAVPETNDMASGFGIPCSCRHGKDDVERSERSDSSTTDGENGEPPTAQRACKCTMQTMSSCVCKQNQLPSLEALNEIEVGEMKELQKNLRQWQLARRNLIESINRSLEKN